MRERLRYRQYSLRTEKAYIHWMKHFIRFSGLHHLLEMEQHELLYFLTVD
ncbi:phage integrase N-terminal SAM-like domain-containing protein [Chitiniphilus eburneus]